MFIRWWKSRSEARKKAVASRNNGEATEPPEKRTGARPALLPYEVVASTFTDVGCRREVNEDAIRYVRPVGPAEKERGSLLLVADGMGGHAAGDLASHMATEVISKVYYESTSGDPHVALQEALHVANGAIYRMAAQKAELKGMGTTCTALVLKDGAAFCAHVGDTRLYLIRDGAIYVMSEDHSLVMEMVKKGLLTQEEARHHEDKNVILRALGLHPAVAVSAWKAPIQARLGDAFLLCSDGLYDLVEDEEIKALVLAHAPHEACQHLIDLAKERGGHDNISVGLLALTPQETPGEDDAPRDTRELSPLSLPNQETA